jgi:hypothetical protein
MWFWRRQGEPFGKQWNEMLCNYEAQEGWQELLSMQLHQASLEASLKLCKST